MQRFRPVPLEEDTQNFEEHSNLDLKKFILDKGEIYPAFQREFDTLLENPLEDSDSSNPYKWSIYPSDGEIGNFIFREKSGILVFSYGWSSRMSRKGKPSSGMLWIELQKDDSWIFRDHITVSEKMNENPPERARKFVRDSYYHARDFYDFKDWSREEAQTHEIMIM